MKKYLIFLAMIVVIPTIALAQNGILNGGFEDWANGKPDHWLTSNIPSFITDLSQTSDANSGSYAIKGEVIEVTQNAFSEPGIFSGKDNTIFENPFIVDKNYEKFTGYYKYSLGNPDSVAGRLEVSVVLNNNTEGRRVAIAEMELPLAGDYTYFEIPFVYDEPTGLIAEVVHVSISIGGNPDGDHNVGSVFYMDDIALDGAVTSLKEISSGTPGEFSLKQNYPNPFNPVTQIEFTIQKSSSVSLKIFNLAGQEIATLVDKNLNAGTYKIDWNAENLSSGTYIYRLVAADYMAVKRMTLIK